MNVFRLPSNPAAKALVVIAWWPWALVIWLIWFVAIGWWWFIVREPYAVAVSPVRVVIVKEREH